MSNDFVTPDTAFVRVSFKDNGKRTFMWPWNKSEILELSEQLMLIEFFGFGYTTFLFPVSKDKAYLEELLIIYEKIAHTAVYVPVVYAETEQEAVRLLFDNNLSRATESVFSLNDLPEDEVADYNDVNWSDIADAMKSHSHLRYYGHGFYGDVGEID